MTVQQNDRRSRVMVVDDERALAGMIANYLDRAGHHVRVVHTGTEAVPAAREWAPDVVVLDLGLPGVDGVEVCRQIRTFSDCLVLMVTARDGETDTLIGLSVGADDYMSKPFSVRELVARVGVLLRRPRASASVPAAGLRLGGLHVDPQAREVLLDGSPVHLTRTEFELLATLLAQPRRAFGRRALIDEIWGPDWVGDEHLVDTHVAHVRRKLDDDPARPRFIETVRGIGYRAGSGS
ncbi:response regulator transcription factor [Luteipulveratus halotolerans]|uniref:PhoR family transcriptional regulator n=1 Tax=Luteipulveratus halotolerans TaxID=1631356 RepID=A0A0L6CJU2_9MICO|nr:response regulator transcription factor [Luteipulveratus halotolerans]KNX37788.1 PhoR family transcriptional regulator [Luteipulveratus halotolerans]